MLFGKLKENDRAILYFRQAFDNGPTFERAHYLFVLCLQQDRPAEAMPYLDYAIANNTSGLNLQPVRSATLEIMDLEKTLATDSTNASVLGRIAHAYASMGNKEGALKYSKKTP
jgi:tetratricopeptide (TPR) repeat protein